jgi:hypothetical protein
VAIADFSGTTPTPDLLGFWWWEVPSGTIAAFLARSFGGRKSAWEKKVPSLQKGYELSVKAGFPQYHAAKPQGESTVTAVAERTGYDPAEVRSYLISLEALSVAGKIDPKWWQVGLSAEAAKSGFLAKVTGATSGVYNRVLLLLGVGAVFFLAMRGGISFRKGGQ